MSAPVQLRFDRHGMVRNLFLACVSIELLFFSLDYHLNFANVNGIADIRDLFNTAAEDSLPSWFSVLQTTLVALTVWAIYVIVRKTGNRWQRRGWLTLAIFLSYLALDDGSFFHERIGSAYDYAAGDIAGSFGEWTLDVFPSYRWQIVFVPFLAVMGLFMFVFLLRQLRGVRPKIVVFAALACLSVAVCMDFFEGLAPDHPLNPYTAIASRWQLDYWTARAFDETPYETLVHFSQSIEESLEMFAMTLLWTVFLGHFGWLARDLRVRFVAGPEAESEAEPGSLPETASGTVPADAGDDDGESSDSVLHAAAGGARRGG